jgi:hypothetical protein
MFVAVSMILAPGPAWAAPHAPFGFWRWLGLGYGPGIHAYHCCPECAVPAGYQGGWAPYGAGFMLEPTGTLAPVPDAEPLPRPGPQAWQPAGWSTASPNVR